MMTKSQGEALVALIHQLRKDWDTPGIRVAVQRAQALGSPADVAVAACRLAANTSVQTPALIAEPGAHWQGTAVGQRLAPDRCVDHPSQPAGRCPDCDKAAATQPPADVLADIRATLAARRRPTERQPEPEANDLTDARARADQETR